MFAAALGLLMMVPALDQTDDWTQFAHLIESSVPRQGRVQLLYELVDPPESFARELVGFDFENGGFIRIHNGDALGVSSAGRQFSGSLRDGCAWIDPPNSYPPAMLHPSGLQPAPAEVLRFVLQQPELVDDLRPTEGGGYIFEMDVVGGVPGAAVADYSEGAIIRNERWIISVGPEGRVRKKDAPISIEYEYGEDQWPIGFRMTNSTGTTRWALVSTGELAPDALTPAGATTILSSVETRRVRDATEELDANTSIGTVPEGYQHDPSHRWSFALVTGGVLILLLGGGVLVRKRYAAA